MFFVTLVVQYTALFDGHWKRTHRQFQNLWSICSSVSLSTVLFVRTSNQANLLVVLERSCFPFDRSCGATIRICDNSQHTNHKFKYWNTQATFLKFVFATALNNLPGFISLTFIECWRKNIYRLNILFSFPTLPVLRKRGKYAQNKKIISTTPCRKLYKGYPTLLPGIFTVCWPHGKY